MRKREQYAALIDYFQQAMPEVETELHYENPFQLLVAVILSAQCTDKRVNLVSPPLFEAFPTVAVMAASTPEVVYEYIKSVSYPNAKARHLVAMAQMLMQDFAGEVPDNLDDLVKCHPSSRLQQGSLCGRYPHLPRRTPSGSRQRQSHHALRRREGTDCTFPRRPHPPRPPLAASPWPLHLSGTPSEVRRLRHQGMVQALAQHIQGEEITKRASNGMPFLMVHISFADHILQDMI